MRNTRSGQSPPIIRRRAIKPYNPPGHAHGGGVHWPPPRRHAHGGGTGGGHAEREAEMRRHTQGKNFI